MAEDGTPSSEAAVEEWRPEFEGQRPPFRPGHELSLRHGFYSPRTVDPLAQEFVDLVLADPNCGHLDASLWRPALWAWARAEAQAQLLTEYIATEGELSYDGVGDLDEDRIHRAYLLLHRAEARATTGRTKLGLDPLSASRIGRDRAATRVDMARVMAELERRERQRNGGRPMVDGEVEP